MKRIKADVIFLLLLSLLLFVWVWRPAICSASGTPEEQTRVVYLSELDMLDSRLTRLAQLSQTQKLESARLKTQLTASAEQLRMLKAQLTTSEQQLTAAQNSLQNANELLAKFAADEKKKRLRIKAQRNTWIAIAIITGIALAVK